MTRNTHSSLNNRRFCAPFALTALSLALLATAAQSASVSPKLGTGLKQLVEQHQAALASPNARAHEDSEALTVVNNGVMMADAEGRALVDLLVDGLSNYDAVRRAVLGLPGVKLIAEDRKYRAGIIEAYVPVALLDRLAKMKGVSAVQGVMRPEKHIGSVTQQGVVQHRVNQVSQDGSGITVGILSDSYNTAANTIGGAPLTIREAQDILSGDLPGPGNPLGNTQPVVVLQDYNSYPNTTGFDEGRAMAQLIHDIAPKARLGYATAEGGEVNFANNIRALAGVPGSPNLVAGFAAQIIVDDVQYFAEGMFSDTVVAQAVDDVTALGVSYFSSAGNTPPTQGYASDFRLVPVGAGATAGTNLNLTNVPPALYAGGFHNFRSDGGQDIAQTIVLTPPTSGTRSTMAITMQWDDPYDVTPTAIGPLVFQQSGALTASVTQQDFTLNNPVAGQQYRIDVQGTSTSTPNADFDAIVTIIQPDGTTLVSQDTGSGETVLSFLPQAGNHTIRVTGYLGDQGTFTVTVNKGTGVAGVTSDFNLLYFRSDTGAFIGATSENNLATNRPIELPGTLQFPSNQKTIQLVIARANTPTAPQPASRLRYRFRDSSYASEYFSYTTPVTYGHNSAAGANGVAAYSPFPPNIPEDFTSTGPVRVVFDRNNNRIPEAQQVRLKPNLAAMDGGNTTFFTSDTSRDPDTFPNFFGTSAAAPNAAAIAALVLQKKGGPGSVTPAQMRTILERSTFPHDLDPYSSRGQAVASNGGKVTVTITGDNSVTSQVDPNATTVAYVGPSSITSITFDATNANPGGGSVITGTNTPGLVFDTRAVVGDQISGGQPFIFGPASVGLVASDVTPSYLNQAPAPSVTGQFSKLKLDIRAGALTGGKSLRFGIDRDERSSAFPSTPTRNGSSADLAGAGVRIPAGTIATGGMTFTGTLADGSTFSGVMANRIGAGYSALDGYGFMNAESAVAQPTP